MDKKLIFNDVKFFQSSDKLFLFNTKNAGLYEIDQNTKKLFNFNGENYETIYKKFSDIWDKKEFYKLIKSFEDNQIIKTEENEIINFEHNISSIVLFVSQICNLNCKYCYGNEGEYNKEGIMNWETAKKAIDFLFNISNSQKLSIIFFGGEPLINFSIIKKSVFYSKELAEKYNKSLRFSITTNGTLVNKEISDFLIKEHFSVTVSIDGDKESHDMNRIYKDGKGSYDELIKKTAFLRNKIGVTARTTVTGDQIDLVKKFKHINSLKFKSIFLAPSFETFNENAYQELLNSNRKLLKEFLIFINQELYKEAKKMKNIYKLFLRIHTGGIKKSFCGAGINVISINIEGNIYICHRFVGIDKYKIGNIYTGLLNDRYNNIIKDISIDNDICSTCWSKNICSAGCPHNNYLKNGSTNLPNQDFCKIQKVFIEEIILKYVTLNDIQKEKLFG